MITLLYLENGRMAIEHDGVRLAVPPIRRSLTRADKVLVLEYVLRRQPALAALIAAGELDDPKSGTFHDVRSLLTNDWQTNDGEAAA